MPQFLDLDEGGRLTAATEAARRYLDERRGRWRIVPAAGDLMLLRRDPPVGGEPPVRAVLTGDTGGFGLGEIVAFLAQSRWTGVLTVVEGPVEKSIFVQKGSVRWATSNHPADRLGEVVQRLGLVARRDLDAVLAQDPGSRPRIGQMLLQKGLLDSAGLYKALRHQFEEIFHSALLMERALFFLFNDPVEARFPAQIALDLNALLMDSLRRIDELEHFRRRIPSADAWPVRRDVQPTGLKPQELAVWEAVDGRRTVRQLAAVLHQAEFDVVKVLFGLAEAGYLEVHTERPEVMLGRTSAGQGRAGVREVVRVFNSIFREVFEEVGRLAPTAGFRLGADAFLASDYHGYPELFGGLALDDEGRIDEERLLANLAAEKSDEDPAARLYDALNELMFFELFQASELLPPDRDEDLSRRVKLVYEQLER